MLDKVWSGRGSIKYIGQIVKDFGGKRILLVTGKASYSNSGIQKYLDDETVGLSVLRYSDFDVNPKLEDLLQGAELTANFKPDIIIGIGGGSVMDTAKLLSVLPLQETQIIDMITGFRHVAERKIKLILIPTTAGSGSEATHFAVAYIFKEKYSVASPFLLSDAIILDSSLTDSMGKQLTAVTAFDALSQAIESIWAVGSTSESQKYAEDSLKIIIEIFDLLIKNPGEAERDKMLEASYLAGKAINISKTTAPHAVSYELTTNYGIPHGLAVAITLGSIIKYNAEAPKTLYRNSDQYAELQVRFFKIFQLLRVKNADEAALKIEKMLIIAGLPTRLREIGMTSKDEIKILSSRINNQRMQNNPIMISNGELVSLLELVY